MKKDPVITLLYQCFNVFSSPGYVVVLIYSLMIIFPKQLVHSMILMQ